MQLTDYSEQLETLGFGVATLTYDDVALLKTVEEDQGIDFPLLHDEAVRVVDALGIRNLDYEPGHRAYGIPYPGILVIDSEGVIRAKFAEEDYRDRPAFDAVIEAAQALQDELKEVTKLHIGANFPAVTPTFPKMSKNTKAGMIKVAGVA